MGVLALGECFGLVQCTGDPEFSGSPDGGGSRTWGGVGGVWGVEVVLLFSVSGSNADLYRTYEFRIFRDLRMQLRVQD